MSRLVTDLCNIYSSFSSRATLSSRVRSINPFSRLHFVKHASIFLRVRSRVIYDRAGVYAINAAVAAFPFEKERGGRQQAMCVHQSRARRSLNTV